MESFDGSDRRYSRPIQSWNDNPQAKSDGTSDDAVENTGILWMLRHTTKLPDIEEPCRFPSKQEMDGFDPLHLKNYLFALLHLHVEMRISIPDADLEKWDTNLGLARSIAPQPLVLIPGQTLSDALSTRLWDDNKRRHNQEFEYLAYLACTDKAPRTTESLDVLIDGLFLRTKHTNAFSDMVSQLTGLITSSPATLNQVLDKVVQNLATFTQLSMYYRMVNNGTGPVSTIIKNLGVHYRSSYNLAEDVCVELLRDLKLVNRQVRSITVVHTPVVTTAQLSDI
jgi:hypothetical protein